MPRVSADLLLYRIVAPSHGIQKAEAVIDQVFELFSFKKILLQRSRRRRLQMVDEAFKSNKRDAKKQP